MRLRPEEEARAEVERLFIARWQELTKLIPGAEVRHIGATSVPGSLTKGDLDVLVIVDRERLAAAAAALEARFAVNQPEIWSETYASFEEVPAGPIAVGVQLVAKGSRDEEVFVGWREALIADPELRRGYDELKQAYADGDQEAYRAAKGRFIEAQGWSFDCQSGGTEP